MLVDESDRIAAALEAGGIDGSSLHLRHELKRIEVSEQEARDYFDAHRESFGDRTFEESWSSVERLVRLRGLREQYSTGDEIVVLVEGFDDEP